MHENSAEPPHHDESAETFSENPPTTSPQRFFLVALAFETGLIGLAVALGAIFGVNPVASLRFSWLDVGWGVVATSPMLAGLWIADRYPIGPLVPLRQLVHDVIVPLFHGTKIWQLAALAVAAGLGEELLFRGFIQAGIDLLLTRWLSPPPALWIALLVTGLLFGLAHFISRTYAILCFAVGIYLGLLWMATGNLLVPVVVHGLYDFVALVYLLGRTPRENAGNAS